MLSIKKHILPIAIVGISIYLFDQGLGWLSGRSIGTLQDEVIKLSYYFLYSIVIGLANIWLVVRLEKMFPWDESPKQRIIYGIIGGVITSMLAIFFLRVFTEIIIDNNTWDEFIKQERLWNYVFPFLISVIVILAFYTVNFYNALTERKIKQHQVVAKTETAKYESLKSQLDPHFLFNSLNVLTSLIGENPKQAEQFTTKLSQVYRYVVEQKDKDLVPLDEELRFAKIYMDLLKMRFEEAIQFNLPQQPIDETYKIVPLSLQLLLENAIKHNVISDESPLTINITIENKEVIVNNNYNPKTTLKKGSGIGLNNIIERYNLISYRKPNIEQTNNFFTVKLPLLTKKTSNMTTLDNKQSRYEEAKVQVEKIKDFYGHLIIYVIVMSFITLVNYFTSWNYKWFVFPLFGWGIGIFFHFLDTFKHNWLLGRNWEEKKIKEIMDEHDKWQ